MGTFVISRTHIQWKLKRIASADPMKEALYPSDDDLLRRMSAGDEEAFTTLYRRRQAAIFRFALHLSGSPSVAEEVTQEVFLVLIRQPEQFDATRGALAAFLFGVARNRVLRCLERERPYVPMPAGGADDWTQDNSGRGLNDASRATENPLENLQQRETIERVRQAVQALPLNYREVVALCDMQEMSYEQAAQVLGCALGTVRSRLHRARALLLDKLRVDPRSANSSTAKKPVTIGTADRPPVEGKPGKTPGKNAVRRTALG